MAEFVSVLTPPLATDARFTALEQLEAKLLAHHDLSGLLPNIVDTAPAWQLPYLAEQFGVLGTEAWQMCPDDDARRELVRNGIRLRKYWGTPWAIEEVFRILGLPAALEEWFNYGGQRGTFRVDITVPDRGIDEDLYNRAVRAVLQYKNLRSHLDRLRVVANSKGTLYLSLIHI